jgi:hypothetical protein
MLAEKWSDQKEDSWQKKKQFLTDCRSAIPCTDEAKQDAGLSPLRRAIRPRGGAER